MGDEQLSMDLGVEQTAWGKWVDPERHATQVRKFLDLAGLDDLPPELWPEDSPELQRLNDICRRLFPDSETPYLPNNQDGTDSFICFFGACFVKYMDGEWIDHTEYGPDGSFYSEGVNPALRYIDYDGDEDETTVFEYIDMMVDHNISYGDGFIHITADLRRKYYNLM